MVFGACALDPCASELSALKTSGEASVLLARICLRPHSARPASVLGGEAPKPHEQSPPCGTQRNGASACLAPASMTMIFSVRQLFLLRFTHPRVGRASGCHSGRPCTSDEATVRPAGQSLTWWVVTRLVTPAPLRCLGMRCWAGSCASHRVGSHWGRWRSRRIAFTELRAA